MIGCDLMCRAIRFQYSFEDDTLNAEIEIEGLVDKHVLVDKLEVMIGMHSNFVLKDALTPDKASN